MTLSVHSWFGLTVASIAVVAFILIFYRADGDGDVPDKAEPRDEEIAPELNQCRRCGRLYETKTNEA